MADVGPSVGLGHFMRSLALVLMVRQKVATTFYGQDSSLVGNILNDHSLPFIEISSTAEFLSHLSPNDIVVLDGYQYDGDFQTAVRAKCHKLFVIDDKHDKDYHADFIINPAPGIGEEDYKVSSNCKLLLGPQYALLRPAFLKERKEAKEVPAKKAVVCFGGADPENMSYSVTKALLTFKKLEEVHLILGPAYSFYNSLALMINDNRLKVSRALNENEMASALAEADFAVVPSSGILYECLTVGTPAISGYYVDNQIYTYEGWLARGAIIGVENFDMELLKSEVRKLLGLNHNVTQLLQNSGVDGKSPERYLSIFNQIIESHAI